MRKQFAVIGLGRFGSSVARTLYSMGNDVLAIDTSEENVQQMMGHVTQAMQADAHNEEVLKSLGLRNFDAVIVAIGEDIQANILVTVMLKEQGVKYIVAKARNELHGKVLSKVGADKVVYPERDMGSRLARCLISDNVLDQIELSPDCNIVEVMATDHFHSQTLGKLNLRARMGVHVLAIKQGSEIIVAPGADAEVHANDVLVVMGATKGIEALNKLLR